jgi:hypothetical protein
MNQCKRCEGFVPDSTDVCPNCRSSKSTWWRIPLAIAGAGFATVTLSACYGPACTARLPDNSNANDPDVCATVDCNSKLPDGGTKSADANWKAVCPPVDAGTLDGG